jgi:hypothetical protein
MIAAIGRVITVALALALALASAGARAARPPVALTASPSHVTMAGSARAIVRVTNSGTSRVVVDVTRAGFALDLRGRPRIVRRGDGRSATRWLVLRPRHLVLRPGGSASLVVASKVPSRAEPGDHDALVLLTTHPRPGSRIAVRMRLGIVVVVRAPGRVVRRLALRGLRVVRHGRARLLELVVANRGNVTESLERTRPIVTLTRGGRRLATLVAARRAFRPGTSGILQFRYHGVRRGWVTARAVIPAEPGRGAVRRTFRIRL